MVVGNYTIGASSSFTNEPGAELVIVPGGTLDNQSSNGFVNDGGTVIVDHGGTVTTSNGLGGYLQTAGLTTVDGSWTQNVTDIEGGQLNGLGTVGGLVINNSNPGSGPTHTGLNAGIVGIDPLVFTGQVTGIGNYGGSVEFDGGFSPGNAASAAPTSNAGGAASPFSTSASYANGTGSVVQIFGSTMIFGATDNLSLDVSGASSDQIVADTAVLGGTLTIVPTAPVAGSYDVIASSGSGSGVSGDFAVAQMLNLGNSSDLYLTRSNTANDYTATLRSTLADYGVAVNNTFTQIGGAGQTPLASGNSVAPTLTTADSSATFATGGNGHNDGPGGNGGDGSATNTVTGPGNSLAVAAGGNGGFGTGAAPNGFGGRGGLGLALSTMLGNGGTSTALAAGGHGGAATGNDVGGDGGAASATASAPNGTGTLASVANATGGTGGNSAFGTGGNGGAANATASAVSTAIANATATATGGSNGTSVNIVTPFATGGGAATANASATGIAGQAIATAATVNTGSVSNVNAIANGTVAGGVATATQAATSVGGGFIAPVTPFDNTVSNNVFAIASGLPNRSSVDAAIVADPNNAAKWTPPTTYVAGTGLLGAITPGGITHSFDAKTDFTFQIPSGYGSTLTIGLLNGVVFNAAAFNSAVDSLSLTITDNATVIFNESFSSLMQAASLFDDTTLTFGTLFGVSNTIGFDLALAGPDNFGFEGNVIAGTVPEPASLTLFGTALLGWIVYRHRRTVKAGLLRAA